jgi:hypothetical protein
LQLQDLLLKFPRTLAVRGHDRLAPAREEERCRHPRPRQPDHDDRLPLHDHGVFNFLALA